jgi:hypothetical protein
VGRPAPTRHPFAGTDKYHTLNTRSGRPARFALCGLVAKNKGYPSDLTDAQRQLIEPLVPTPQGGWPSGDAFAARIVGWDRKVPARSSNRCVGLVGKSPLDTRGPVSNVAASWPQFGYRGQGPDACHRRAARFWHAGAVATSRRLVTSGSPLEPEIGFSRAVRSRPYICVAGTAPIGADGSTVAPARPLRGRGRRIWVHHRMQDPQQRRLRSSSVEAGTRLSNSRPCSAKKTHSKVSGSSGVGSGRTFPARWRSSAQPQVHESAYT